MGEPDVAEIRPGARSPARPHWRRSDRVVAGILGVAAGAGTAWLTLIWVWLALWDVGCPMNMEGSDLAESAALSVLFSAVWGLGWSIAAALLAVAARGRGLRARACLVAPLLCSLISLATLGLGVITDPGPGLSEACQSWD